MEDDEEKPTVPPAVVKKVDPELEVMVPESKCAYGALPSFKKAKRIHEPLMYSRKEELQCLCPCLYLIHNCCIIAPRGTR